MRRFKAATETQSGIQHLNFKGLTEHSTLWGTERSSVCRKCNQRESGRMLRALLTMQTAEIETLFAGLVVLVLL